MSGPELRRAIEGPPSTAAGRSSRPGRPAAAGRRRGAGRFPLLSHALLETWQRRHGRSLTLDGYAAAGGVQGALAQTAERVFAHRLTQAQQPIARRIFVELTELGEGTQDTRRRAVIAELARVPDEEPAIRAVLQVLSEARLVTLDEHTAEVAHEALIREWPTLRDWLNQDREGLRLHRALGAAARDWKRLGRDAGLLYRGVRLEQALEWAREHGAELSSLEGAFIAEAHAVAEREIAEREAQHLRELEATARSLTPSSDELTQNSGARTSSAEQRASSAKGRCYSGLHSAWPQSWPAQPSCSATRHGERRAPLWRVSCRRRRSQI